MNDPLNDPMVVAVDQVNGKLPLPNEKLEANPIEEFFQELHQSIKSDNMGPGSQKPQETALHTPIYTTDYKPEQSRNKTYVYSIDELFSYSEELPAATSENVINSLPKKKFWRLNRRFSDHGAHGKNVGHKNSKSSGPNRLGSNEDLSFERRNSKNKGTRAAHPKRGSRFGKNDGLMEEKDIAVNNDDLLALEEEFEPTGNTMADFEMWKAKMKEMERKKKGLTPSDANEMSEPVAAVSATSSSISDFLKLNTKSSDVDAAHLKSLQDTKALSETSTKLQGETLADSAVGASSRFSSFFTSSATNNSSSALTPTESERTSTSTVKVTEAPSNASSGSRLMSFFNKEEKAGTDVPQFSNSPREQPKFMPPPGFPPQNRAKEQHQNMAAHPAMPSFQHIAQQQPQTNNAFFQDLLNKNKVGGDPFSPGPPPGVTLPNNASHIPPQGQHLRQTGQPNGVGAPPGFSLGIQPPGFASSIQGGPVQMPNRMPMINNTKENGHSNSVNQKNNRQQPMQQRQPPMQPGMIPQQFVPPPGFPPMHSMPPNFNQNMYMPSNGMMPPMGQQFFPPVPPPSGAMNFPPFPNQAGFAPQKGRK